MVLYLDRMCQRWLQAVLWSHIGTLMHCLAAEPLVMQKNNVFSLFLFFYLFIFYFFLFSDLLKR